MGYDMRSMIFFCFDTAAVTQTDSNVIYVISFSSLIHLRGCSSVVERALCMREVRGSKPRISTFRFSLFPGELSFNFFSLLIFFFQFFSFLFSTQMKSVAWMNLSSIMTFVYRDSNTNEKITRIRLAENECLLVY